MKKSKYINILIGSTFSEWTTIDSPYKVERQCETRKRFDVFVSCKCSCGNVSEIRASQLLNGKSHKCKKCVGKDLRKGYKDISGHSFARLVSGATKRGLDVSITIKDIYSLWLKQDKKCALTGEKVLFSPFSKELDTASVDRIDSSKGYHLDNIQILHKDINRMKWEFTSDKFIEWCTKIIKYNK